MDTHEMHSGNVGYCEQDKKSRGILITWAGREVIAVDCEHKTCGYGQICKLYNQYPIGYVHTPAISLTSEKP